LTQEWSRPDGLTKTDYYFDVMQGAVAHDGTAVVAFVRGNDIPVKARVRSAATGEWGHPDVIVRRSALTVLTAASDGGSVAAVWLDELNSRLMIRRHGPDGWGRAHGLDVTSADELVDIDMNARGDVAVAMRRYPDGVLAAVSPIGGPWRKGDLLDGSATYFPRRALIDDDGSATVVVEEQNSEGTGTAAVVVGHLGASGQWATTRLTPPDGFLMTAITAETGPGGTIAIPWVEYEHDSVIGRLVIEVAGPGEPFSRRVLAATDDRDCPYYRRCAEIDFARGDRLAVAWSTDGKGSGVRAAERAADGTWSPTARIPIDDPHSQVIHTSLSDDGSIVIEGYADFASCSALTSCVSVGLPKRWAPLPSRAYSWLAAGPAGSASLLYGEKLCEGRCFGRPYWTELPPA
jgi:hypothetical protein